MGEKTANEHLSRVAEGLQEIQDALHSASGAFGNASDTLGQAYELLDEDIPPLLEQALIEEMQSAINRINGEISPHYAEAGYHFNRAGLHEAENVHARNALQALADFDHLTDELSQILEAILPPVNELGAKHGAAKKAIANAHRAAYDTTYALSEDSSVIIASVDTSYAQDHLKDYLNSEQ